METPSETLSNQTSEPSPDKPAEDLSDAQSENPSEDSVPEVSLKTYLEGIQALHEGGRYRQSLDVIATALDTYPKSDALLLWEAIATNAVGETSEAISLVKSLANSGDLETRQQARYLAQIWSAPSLERHEEWQVNMNAFNKKIGASKASYVSSAAKGTISARKSKMSVPDAPEKERPRSFWITALVTGTLTLILSNFLIYWLR